MAWRGLGQAKPGRVLGLGWPREATGHGSGRLCRLGVSQAEAEALGLWPTKARPKLWLPGQASHCHCQSDSDSCQTHRPYWGVIARELKCFPVMGAHISTLYSICIPFQSQTRRITLGSSQSIKRRRTTSHAQPAFLKSSHPATLSDRVFLSHERNCSH